ncbi:MAG: hypothetical protein AABZ55_14920, partial [Bdellovibrionota bacterium]
KVVDRVTTDRVSSPLLVAAACVEALKLHKIKSRVMYGHAAWIEVLSDHSLIWAGCWGENLHFWVETEYGERVDLNSSQAHRKKPDDRPELSAIYSPPMLWTNEAPTFFRYRPIGIAAAEPDDESGKKQLDLVLREIREKCGPEQLGSGEPEFANEAILCPGRKILDDSLQSFQHYDRALSVRGIPEAPEFE